MSERKDYLWENLNERISKLENNGIPGVRDFFATSALSMLARENTIYWAAGTVAEKAYAIADAMMVERAK
jgi:hypothetical protein